MGMFDYVRCEVPLPDGFEGQLQTKDFDCTMSTVVIRKDGHLEIERFEYEEVPKADRPYPNDEGILGIVGMLRRVHERWEPLYYHGVMRFYGNEGRYGEPGYRWHEYEAKFTDGRLVTLTPTEQHDEPPSQELGDDG